MVVFFGRFAVAGRPAVTGKAAKDAAFLNGTRVGAGLLESFESLFEACELLQPFANVNEVAGKQSIDVATVGVGLLGQSDQLANFVLRHVQIATTLNEPQAIEMGLGKGAVSVAAPVGRRE